MAVIIVLKQDNRWVSVNLYEQTNEPTSQLSTGRWTVRASSLHPDGKSSENDLSPVHPQYYVWLFAGATLVLADSLPRSSPGGLDPTEFDSIAWLTDVGRIGTENYAPPVGRSEGSGRFWGGSRPLSPGMLTWSRQRRSNTGAYDGGGRSPPSRAP